MPIRKPPHHCISQHRQSWFNRLLSALDEVPYAELRPPPITTSEVEDVEDVGLRDISTSSEDVEMEDIDERLHPQPRSDTNKRFATAVLIDRKADKEYAKEFRRKRVADWAAENHNKTKKKRVEFSEKEEEESKRDGSRHTNKRPAKPTRTFRLGLSTIPEEPETPTSLRNRDANASSQADFLQRFEAARKRSTRRGLRSRAGEGGLRDLN